MLLLFAAIVVSVVSLFLLQALAGRKATGAAFAVRRQLLETLRKLASVRKVRLSPASGGGGGGRRRRGGKMEKVRPGFLPGLRATATAAAAATQAWPDND